MPIEFPGIAATDDARLQVLLAHRPDGILLRRDEVAERDAAKVSA